MVDDEAAEGLTDDEGMEDADAEESLLWASSTVDGAGVDGIGGLPSLGFDEPFSASEAAADSTSSCTEPDPSSDG